MKSITQTLSVLALSAAVAAPTTFIGAAPADAYDVAGKEATVELVGFRKLKKLKKSGFKKHLLSDNGLDGK